MIYAIEDSDVLAALREWGRGSMTYVVRNRLAMRSRPQLKTEQVRRQLERMEKNGKVVRVESVYARQICWALADTNGTVEGDRADILKAV